MSEQFAAMIRIGNLKFPIEKLVHQHDFSIESLQTMALSASDTN